MDEELVAMGDDAHGEQADAILEPDVAPDDDEDAASQGRQALPFIVSAAMAVPSALLMLPLGPGRLGGPDAQLDGSGSAQQQQSAEEAGAVGAPARPAAELGVAAEHKLAGVEL